ncbi:MAG: hypothetical protein U1E64_14620 [Sphingomonadaceae bacterium]
MEVRKDAGFLDSLARFVATLALEIEDDLDDLDDDDEEEKAVPQPGRRAAEAAFCQSTARKSSVRSARKCTLSKTSRNAQVLAWLDDRGSFILSLGDLGSRILTAGDGKKDI